MGGHRGDVDSVGVFGLGHVGGGDQPSPGKGGEHRGGLDSGGKFQGRKGFQPRDELGPIPGWQGRRGETHSDMTCLEINDRGLCR